MAIKLVAMDMDGTLLHNDKSAPADFVPWVLSHPGIRVVLASGRQYYKLLEAFPGLEDRLVFLAENGAVVYSGGSRLHINPMSYEQVRLCLERAEKLGDVSAVVCGAKSAYMKPCSPEAAEEIGKYYARLAVTDDLYKAAEGDEVVKVAVYFKDGSAPAAGAGFGTVGEGIVHTVSGTDWIDLGLIENNKGTAIRAIQRHYGIEPAECMAFGDYMNDYELLQSCSESYAMANGCEELRAAAKHIAPSNEEDGVMQVLYSEFG